MGRSKPSPCVHTVAPSCLILTQLIHHSVNSMLLDVTGILFAAQLVILLGLGPYADYGNWRPYIMMCELIALLTIVPGSRLTRNSLPGPVVPLPVRHVWLEQGQSVAGCPGALRDRLPRSVASFATHLQQY